MKSKDLREWLFKNRLEDSWYVSASNHLFEQLMTLDEIENYNTKYPAIPIKLLHPSMTDLKSPPWVEYEGKRADAPTPATTDIPLPPGMERSVPTPPQAPGAPQRPEAPSAPESAGKRGVTRVPFAVKKDKTTKTSLASPTPQPSSGGSKSPFPAKKRVKFDSSQEQIQAARELENSTKLWTPQKMGMVAAGIILMLGLTLFMLSGNEDIKKATAPVEINSKVAYYETQKLLRNTIGERGQLSFPSHSANGVFHEEMNDNYFRIHGFVRVIGDEGSSFESYDAVTHATQDGKWSLVYLKSGDTKIGAIPSNLQPKSKTSNIAGQ